MEITFEQLREKEIINISSGKKLGRIIDLAFELGSGKVKGIMVPGDRKLFKKSEDIFIPIRQIHKIGDDVILVRLNYITAYENVLQAQNLGNYSNYNGRVFENKRQLKLKKGKSFIRYRRISNNKYK